MVTSSRTCSEMGSSLVTASRELGGFDDQGLSAFGVEKEVVGFVARFESEIEESRIGGIGRDYSIVNV